MPEELIIVGKGINLIQQIGRFNLESIFVRNCQFNDF